MTHYYFEDGHFLPQDPIPQADLENAVERIIEDIPASELLLMAPFLTPLVKEKFSFALAVAEVAFPEEEDDFYLQHVLDEVLGLSGYDLAVKFPGLWKEIVHAYGQEAEEKALELAEERRYEDEEDRCE